MTSADYLIDFNGRKPAFTAYFILPQPLLQLLTPYLLTEIMSGQVDSCGADRVALHLTLSAEKELLIKDLVHNWQNTHRMKAA